MQAKLHEMQYTKWKDSNNKQHQVLCISKAWAYINLDHDILIIMCLLLKDWMLNWNSFQVFEHII